MNKRPITVVRVYTLEGDERIEQALEILHDRLHIMGATVLRGIEGMGAKHGISTSSLVDLSLALPLVLEFYDEPELAEQAIEALQTQLHFDHLVSLPGLAHF